MPRRALAVVIAVVTASTLGCGKAEPAPAPPSTPTTGARAAPDAGEPVTSDPGLPDAGPSQPSTATGAAAEPDAREGTAPEGDAGTALAEAHAAPDAAANPDAVATAEAVPEADVAGTPTPLVALPVVVDQASCEAACAHALRIAEADLPADASDETRGALRQAMLESCPRTCLEQASVESLRCIMKAETVLGLGACPE